jgi:hypothetical protein
MGQPINYDLARDVLQKLNTDDTISSAHGLLCGFYCVKQDIQLDDWLNEVLVSIDLNDLIAKESHQVLAEIFNNTSDQLADPTLNFWPVIADDMCPLREQANTPSANNGIAHTCPKDIMSGVRVHPGPWTAI